MPGVTYVWLDFEASSLRPASYPIEVGWVDEDGQGESYLIIPEESWTDWSTDSEAIHNIPRDTLYREGRPASEVARRVHDVLARPGVVACVTSEGFDGLWLRRLLDVADLPAPRVHSHLYALDAAVRPILRLSPSRLSLHYLSRRAQIEAAVDVLIIGAEDAERERAPTAHRALEDATSTWRVWRTVTDAVAEYVAQNPPSTE